MDDLNLHTNTIHLGDRANILAQVKKEIYDSYGTDNVSTFEIEKLNLAVDDVRRMVSYLNKSSEETKFCLLSSFYWSDEVQNALLKVLEETPKNTHIHLFAWSDIYFLPTVLSRVQKRSLGGVNKYKDIALKVLKLPKNERLESKEVKKILSQKVVDINYEKDTENEKKDRESHILFLDALLRVIVDNKVSLGLKKEFLEKLTKVSSMLGIEGGSPHLFIEWLLLSTDELDAMV